MITPTESPPSETDTCIASSAVHNLSAVNSDGATPTRDNRPVSSRDKRKKSSLAIHQERNRHNLPYDPHLSVDFTKTPRSLEIRRDDNKILRMPDSTMMFQVGG